MIRAQHVHPGSIQKARLRKYKEKAPPFAAGRMSNIAAKPNRVTTSPGGVDR